MRSLNEKHSRNLILEQVKRVVFSHLSGRSAKVYLFGSWARGEEKRSSDIDVAIEFETNETMDNRTLASLRHALEESTIPYKVDVVNLNSADNAIVDKVRKEGILWGELTNE